MHAIACSSHDLFENVKKSKMNENIKNYQINQKTKVQFIIKYWSQRISRNFSCSVFRAKVSYDFFHVFEIVPYTGLFIANFSK